jgi:transposase
MMNFDSSPKVFLHKAPVDFRKQINGLSLIVQDGLNLDPFMESLFVFINRERSRIKILYWQRNGFCLWQKRLEKDRFIWPKNENGEAIIITTQELQWLLDGFNIWQHPPHQILKFSSV